MNVIFFTIINLYISFSFQNAINDGIYNIMASNYYLEYSKRKIIISTQIKNPSTFFRINKLTDPKEKPFYHIEEIYSDYRNKLSYSEAKELIIPRKFNKRCSSWNFIKTKNNKYKIRNQNQCYVRIIDFKTIICDDIPLEMGTEFELFKIYEEIKEKKEDNELIEKEPIDVLIKYIDLRDEELKRNFIHQINKDYDNEELRYSIRSILRNIPWIRKIFVLMPNDKVRFFKEYISIKEKIVYIKDSDILGYDSSNINAFLFRYWRLARFGISNNFIVMDDDCFIGKPLKKKDFFYVENGKVVPAIVNSNFIKIEKYKSQINCDLYRNKVKNEKYKQNSDAFNYSLYLTYLFIFEIFKKTLRDYAYVPKFTHNAIPVNVDDLKEIYSLVFYSQFKSTTLDSLYRKIGYIQFQQLVLSYTFIKFNRKIRHISNSFIKINEVVLSNIRHSLFCINTGDDNYSYLIYYKARIVMEYLFPISTPYEIIDYSFANLSFNVVKSMEKTIKNCYAIINEFNIRKKVGRTFLLIMLFLLMKNYFNNNYKNYEILALDE